MDTETLLRAEYRLGLEAELFWNSELGDYLKGVSEQEIEGYRTDLELVDPEDAKAIREIQYKIAIAKGCLAWLDDAIKASYEAEEQLKE